MILHRRKGAAILSVQRKTSLKGAAVLSVQRKKLRARFDAASRLTNLPRAIKRTGRAVRALTFFRIFYEDARGRAEGREAAKARARHLSADTQHAEFILSLSKDFECRRGYCATLDPAARSAVGDKSAQPGQRPSMASSLP